MTLDLHDCTFRYRRNRPPVITGLDFRLPPGLTVLLGPRGAGKSTLLGMAAGALRPTSGSVAFRGVPSHRRAYRRAVGWMPQQTTAMAGHTAREQVAHVGWLKGMTRRDAWDAAPRALSRVDLADRADAKVRTLSGGLLRRVGLAAALVHRASLLILDEPTTGLDPRQRRILHDLLADITHDDPATQILMSTHDPTALAETTDHTAVLTTGHLTYTGPTPDFLHQAPPTPTPTTPDRTMEAAFAAVTGAP